MIRPIGLVLVYLALRTGAGAQIVIDSAGIPRDHYFTIGSAAYKAQRKYPDVQAVMADVPLDVNALYNIVFARYGSRELKLDIFQPAGADTSLTPCVIFIHGGGWRSGTREMDWPMAIRIARAGFVTVTVEHRLSPEAKYPAAVHDIKAAVRWLRAHAPDYHIDTNSIAVSGFSSGAQLAALVGVTEGAEQFEGTGGSAGHSSSVQAIISIDGDADLTASEAVRADTIPAAPTSEALWLGGTYAERPERWKEASPLSHVTARPPPIFFLNSSLERYHAGRDEMAAAMRALGIPVEIVTLPDTPHTFMFFTRWFETAADHITAFLNSTFTPSRSRTTKPRSDVNIIPTPLEMHDGAGEFIITSAAHMIVCAGAADAAAYLNLKFITAAGFELAVKTSSERARIEFKEPPATDSLGDEGYRLDVTPARIVISAHSRAGFFYAVQTLLQLLPSDILGSSPRAGVQWRVPAVTIRDRPKYSWRSFMLDSGRQYQTVGFIKEYLDRLAQLKINVFHWHLTEGQGWRIEIKKYPRLTEIGSRVAAGEEQQGFYTQDEIKDVVEYARRLCITVVPEIDLPGHSEAALIAYPHLTCLKRAPSTAMEFSSHLFCGGSESTYTFIEDVLSEVCDLFPGEYIHLGGDEAPKNDWDSCAVCQEKMRSEHLTNSHELQLYFSARLASFLNTRGRKCILWGDVVEQGGPRLPKNVVIHWWNYRKKHDAAYTAALERGYPIICGTNYYTYLNFPVTPWSRYLDDRTFDLRQAYTANPSDMQAPSSLVLGMSVSLWTDWHVTMRMIDQRVYPRILVLAEQMWGSGKRQPFTEYYEKVRQFYPQLTVQGIQYGPALREDVPPGYSWEGNK